ncbi:MAG: FAD-dependent oxidoreductase [Thermoguttaceae bacterium]
MIKASGHAIAVLLVAAATSTFAAEPPAARVPLASELPGIVLDDESARYTGDWIASNKQTPLLGATYRHDNATDPGSKTATFTTQFPAAGEYELRLIYVWHANRASNVAVTVLSAEGEKKFHVDQRSPLLVDGLPRPLGVFRFEADRPASVTVSNEGADGFVVVDGLQFLPVDVANQERAGKRPSGFVEPPRSEQSPDASRQRNAAAAAVALSPLAGKTVPASKGKAPSSRRSDEPVRLAADSPPELVDGKSFDVVVVGATSGGIACAVRAAREGCSVLLVQHDRHLGGMMTNGLMQWDALYGGPRAPLFTELLGNIERYYIATFGRDSKDHQTIRYTHEHYPIGWAEPHVAEREYNRLVAAEKKITLLLGHYPTAVDRQGTLLRGVTLTRRPATDSPPRQPHSIRVSAATFVDATYEGDLLALAKVPYRVGREARDEFGEPHAGKVFVNIASGPAPSVAAEGLNIRSYGSHQGSVDPTSPFTADGAVQAFNYRFCVTTEPDNRLPIPKPESYNRDEYLHYGRKSIGTNSGPNFKSHVNSPILPGENHAYPEADWPARDKITRRHLEFGLGLMWFLQNDESVPPREREKFRAWGLAKDEFADNAHVPYEMYVREARRLVGRHVITEQDGMLAPDYARTPIQPDSIAITDWYMDSHACTTDSRPGYHYDGKLILTEESRPSQIPYRSLLPQGVDNLLVPVCLSATHVAWGAIRLEPVFMATGEAAGVAAALARQQKTTVAGLDPDILVRALALRRHLVTFFNNLKVTDPDPAIAAAQYFGTKGFFAGYNARLEDPLSELEAKVWAEGLAQLAAGTLNPRAMAARVSQAETGESPATAIKRGAVLRQMWQQLAGPAPGDATGDRLPGRNAPQAAPRLTRRF